VGFRADRVVFGGAGYWVEKQGAGNMSCRNPW